METEPFVRLLSQLREADDHLIHSILVAKDGALVFEAYFDGSDMNFFDENLLITCTLCLKEVHFTRDDLHFTASVTKSITSMVLGIAMDRGHISGTELSMLSFFPDYAHLRTPAKDSITIHHMLSMTAGLPYDEGTYPIADPRNDARRLFVTEDPVAFVLGADVVHAPGTTYIYNSGTTVLLGEIIRRSTGQSFSAFTEEHLFRPLGITSHKWAEFIGAPDVPFASGGLYLRPRDMAKIGQLMLQDGVWNGRRILSSDWVQRSLTMAIALFDRGRAYGYGYQWRLARFGGFTGFYGVGWGGQYIVVLPELNIVFVQTGGRFAGERIPISYATIIERYVLPALRHQ
jgi:CubicO group peptidase (beta-lactamase class C family)